ncbi:DUF6807 domain-containing protein [Mucilaginibacter myungsuensis]|uniref:PmoA family protein n=1 Tax=Mucilaginibacter myungsuensis TaxID=649104 RepID=A0A929KWY7_9SPHI|nr:PmoA family protein [Mucilaginibacter myungsuensis]MBE9661978.1 PmoA family protein [Mucilaginibacter myungsuensis]MDN3599589.1 PmoA family protein [Mucilaginibacter myungsuensis]
MRTIKILTAALALASASTAFAQQQAVTVKASPKDQKIDIMIGGKPFTTFNYPDSLEKPFLFPLNTAGGTTITRGFPLATRKGDPTDHPHHIGLWFNHEGVNGLDFWNNSYAIPAAKKNKYGWIRTDKITETKGGKTGIVAYHAKWHDQAKETLLDENTRFEFSGTANERVIDRITTLTAAKEVNFTDNKDGVLGLRLAHELQIPTKEDLKYTDDRGIETVVKGSDDKIANGNYAASNGKYGNDVWSSRADWCKVYAKMGNDSVSIAIIDHPKNPNYPTFWHARGYGLFAANPLGEKVFTNGKSALNLKLKKGESITFSYRIVISNGKTTLSGAKVTALAAEFAKK